MECRWTDHHGAVEYCLAYSGDVHSGHSEVGTAAATTTTTTAVSQSLTQSVIQLVTQSLSHSTSKSMVIDRIPIRTVYTTAGATPPLHS
jgi:hypothetical protein